MVQRMCPPEGLSANALAKEAGVSQNTLSRWLREARTFGPMGKNQSKNKGGSSDPRRWSAEERLQVLNEASALSAEELGAFLRKKGLHEAQLEEWRELATDALKNLKKKRSTRTPEARRIKELERELLRKDRALAEVTALLALKKKVQEIWGDGGDDTPTRSGT